MKCSDCIYYNEKEYCERNNTRVYFENNICRYYVQKTGIIKELAEKVAYSMLGHIERVLRQVLDENPNVSINDLVLRFNCNHIPMDVISKDGNIIYYEFEKW